MNPKMNKEKPDLIKIAEIIKEMIDDTMYDDQASTYRQLLGKWIGEMQDAYAPAPLKPFRYHLGASLIGADCDRALWYGNRWVKQNKFPAKILRLFNLGHLSESFFIAMLESIGIQVKQSDESTGKQFNFKHANSHFGGSSDGIAYGVPMIDEPVLLEFKTYSSKTFKKLQKEGVEKSKNQHTVQMRVGLEKLGLNYALYMAYCKDDSEIYVELIEANKYIALHYLERAEEIIFTETPPKRIADSPVAKECTFCDFVEICHRADYSQTDTNCRSCRWSYPSQHENEQSEWICGKHLCVIPKENAMFGCAKWEIREL
jgi:hypothetical protein